MQNTPTSIAASSPPAKCDSNWEVQSCASFTRIPSSACLLRLQSAGIPRYLQLRVIRVVRHPAPLCQPAHPNRRRRALSAPRYHPRHFRHPQSARCEELLAAQPELVTPVLRVVQRVVARHLLQAAGLHADEGQGGAVTLIQRFGSAAKLNIHLHCLVLDGGLPLRRRRRVELHRGGCAPDDELHALLQTVIARLMKMVTRRAVLVEDNS